jgi:hypothetical protein
MAGAVAYLIETSSPVSLRKTSAAAARPGSIAPALRTLISPARTGLVAKQHIITTIARVLIYVLPAANCATGADAARIRRDRRASMLPCDLLGRLGRGQVASRRNRFIAPLSGFGVARQNFLRFETAQTRDCAVQLLRLSSCGRINPATVP